MASEAAVNWWDQIGMYLLRERWRYMGIAAFDAGAAHQKAKDTKPMVCGNPTACLDHAIGEPIKYPSDPPGIIRVRNSSHCLACARERELREALQWMFKYMDTDQDCTTSEQQEFFDRRDKARALLSANPSK